MVHRLAQPDGWSRRPHHAKEPKNGYRLGLGWPPRRSHQLARRPGGSTGGAGGNAGGYGGAGGGGGGGGLSYTESPRVSDGQVINAKGYRGLGHTDGIVIITPVFG